MYENLGKKVSCKGYYKQVRDGVHIECFDEDNVNRAISDKPTAKAYSYDKNGTAMQLEFQGDGIEKTLRELTEISFDGVCVGETVLPIKEYLYSDTSYHPTGEEFGFIGKQITQTCECYVIYYANNKKRYVPKDYCDFK